MKKIVFTLQLTEAQLERVRDVAHGWEIVSGEDKAEWQDHLKDALVIAGWNRTVEERFLADPDIEVEWVHNWGAGVDRLPLQAFQSRRVTLTNSSGVHAYPISETILALMLGLTRKIHTYVRSQQQHVWHHANLSAEMHGKTVGILGVGAIGLETARICKAFGMQVLGVRRSGEPSEFVDQMYTMDGLSTVLGASDYVVNTLPYTKETYHLIGQSEFTAMKTSSFYINIGRGGTTDETALIDALQTGQMAGAGLDVFETEPLPADSPLWDMENVILTPHTSGSTEHYNDRALDILIDNLKDFVVGRSVSRNVVNLELEY